MIILPFRLTVHGVIFIRAMKKLVRTNLADREKALLEYYKEQLAHGRHIEVQRSTIASIAFAATGAIIGRLLSNGLNRDQLPYTVTLVVLGLFSWLLSAKLYERFRLHNDTARFARDRLNPNLQEFRRAAEASNKKEFPILFEINLHVVWECFFAVIVALGIVLSVLILRK